MPIVTVMQVVLLAMPDQVSSVAELFWSVSVVELTCMSAACAHTCRCMLH